MTELELLNAIADGHNAFCRDHFPDLDQIDRDLRFFADQGYFPRVIRAVFPNQDCRIDVIGGLTPIGEMRRTHLARLVSSS